MDVMTVGLERENRAQISLTEVAGVDLRTLAAKFGTPLYVLDQSAIERQAAQLVDAFYSSDVIFYYSCKANANPAVVRLLWEHSFGVDACSSGDVAIAEKAGVSLDHVSYTGVGLTQVEIDELIAKGIKVNVSSESELRRAARAQNNVSLGVRVNPEVEIGSIGHCKAGVWGSKLGIPVDGLLDFFELARSLGVRVTGLHVHAGSGESDETKLLECAELVADQAHIFDALEYINFGGGFSPLSDHNGRLFDVAAYAAGIQCCLAKASAACGRAVRGELEPGQFLVDSAGYLLTEVTTVTTFQRSQQSKHVAVVDANINHYIGSSIYQPNNRISLIGETSDTDNLMQTVCGNSNQAGDIFAKERLLPALREGDLLIIHDCGAYGYSRSANFNEKLRAPEVLVKDGKAKLIRRGETVDDMLSTVVDGNWGRL